MLKIDKISVIGLGYVGLPLAVELSKKFTVIGYDIDKNRVNSLKKNIDFTNEISKEELRKFKFEITSDKKKLKKANVFIITLPTPVDNKNNPDLSFLKNATETISNVIQRNSLIIYESTVYPGVTEEVCLPILIKNSKLIYNKDFFLGYSPERINPGDKKNKLRKISKVISASSKEALDTMQYIYSKIVKAEIYKAESIKIAEASKVIENTQRDLNIALMNELFIIFDKLNIPISDIIKASRTKWNFLNFVPGFVGGHCIGVDPYYLTYKAGKEGISTDIILSGRKINNNFHNYIAKKLIFYIKKFNFKKEVLILGATFKQDVPDFRNSRIKNLIEKLKSKKIKTFVYDPYLKKNLSTNTLTNIKNINIFKSKKKYDLIFLAVPHKQFLRNQKNIYKLLSSRGKIYDFRKCLNKQNFIIQN